MSRQAVEEFLSEVRSREQPHNAGLVSQPTAVKFLMARKFDVSRAIDLFQAYKVWHCFDWWQKHMFAFCHQENITGFYLYLEKMYSSIFLPDKYCRMKW